MAFCGILIVLFIATLADVCLPVHSQPSTQGFISIDCGLANGTQYNYNGIIPFASDHKYLDSGTIPGQVYNISSTFTNSEVQTYDKTLRSFPNGKRSCYTLQPVTAGSKYLVRATFLHGNYDGESSMPVSFELHIGTDLWRTVNISDASKEYRYELITVAPASFIWICLANIGTGTPFMSALELRPIDSNMYQYVNSSISNALVFNLNYGPTAGQIIRFPQDQYDRIWIPYEYDNTAWMEISTNSSISRLTDVDINVPITVLQTAVTPRNPKTTPNMSVLKWNAETDNGGKLLGYYMTLHFTEFDTTAVGNMSRWFSIYENGGTWVDAPAFQGVLMAIYAYNFYPEYDEKYDFALIKSSNSTLPPIINAFHVFSPISHSTPRTDLADVEGMVKIRAQYQVTKNWMGDPCMPNTYAWDGLQCKIIGNSDLRITHLDMSRSNLSGAISQDLSSLDKIIFLDLSYNNLTGIIPGWLAKLQSLQVLNLSGNSFVGDVPKVLLDRAQSGVLSLRVDSICYNDNSCYLTPNSSSSKHGKKGVSTAVIIVISLLAVVLVIGLTFLLLKTRARRHLPSIITASDLDRKEPKAFTYTQLKNITSNFREEIGKGGFGVVYRGKLEDDTDVAVKVSSRTLPDQVKQFLTEAKTLITFHHKNLVSLVGYCRSNDALALVYEYMSNGSLEDHIRGSRNIESLINWEIRLRIAYEAAQGLDYLHSGCNTVHRDVKSGNILLGKNFQAKVSDFGLAKIFGVDATNNSSMTLCGTPGYIDPEYQRTFQLTEKNDVYSFGVVLLEIITGKPPILVGWVEDAVHITNYVKQKISRGSIEEIMDVRVGEEYDSTSVWKVLDLALRCTGETARARPSMSEVVHELRECLHSALRKQDNNRSLSYADDTTEFGAFDSISTSFDPVTR